MSLGDFHDEGLLRQALTHRSAGRPNNERLEFFGDALLDLVISESLLERHPRADEGALTRMRASVVRESSLAGVARRLGLGNRLILGSGELKSGGYRRDSILADAVEAVIAACAGDARELVSESADVLYHLMVLLHAKGIALEEVFAELQRRTRQSGLQEKASRKSSSGEG